MLRRPPRPVSLEWRVTEDRAGEGLAAPHQVWLTPCKCWGPLGATGDGIVAKCPVKPCLGQQLCTQRLVAGGKKPKQPPPKSPLFSIFTEIRMAVNKILYGFCARISQCGAPEKLCEQIEGTQLNLIGLVDSVADRILGHANIGSVSLWLSSIFIGTINLTGKEESEPDMQQRLF